MEPITLILVFLIAFTTSFAGAISGGVGLVLRPALIFLGIPAVSVVGTAKVSALFGKIPTIYLLHKKSKIDWKLVGFLAIPMFLGSFIGVIMVVSILKSSIQVFIGILLVITGIILLVNKSAGLEEKKPRFPKKTSNVIGFLGTTVISFFNTITGGMGPIFSSFYIANYGKTYISASALGKAASYIGTGIASVIFIVSGVVDWQLFLVLVCAVLLGSYFGTRFGLKRGDKLIRYLVLFIVFASAIKMIFSI